jgi:hypothetical protein
MKPFLLSIVALATTCSSWAESPSPSSATGASRPPLACVAPEFRQFDFWLGRWKVMNPQGKEIGTSEISRVSEGCAVREQWKSASGSSGTSINYYDADNHKWHQDWVGGDGTILHLHGGLAGNAMVLSGQSKTANKIVLNRITWTPLPGGKVKQEWATSPDDGRTWQISFVGIYEKQS